MIRKPAPTLRTAGVLLFPAAVLLLAASCADSRSYATGKSDDDYPLDAMMLVDSDLPAGIARTDEKGFANDEWASVFPAEDTDATKTTLDGQQRIRNHIAFFTWENPQEHFGKVLSITSQSTLYKDEASASKSLHEYRFGACGLILTEQDASRAEAFAVPRLGNDAVGLFISQQQETLGTSIDTVVCFRTGRIVHAVVQTGLDGTQDVALSVTLAERMLAHVQAALDSKATPTPSGG